MKALVADVLSIFSAKKVVPVFINDELTQQEKEAIHPTGVTTVSWATSMVEINDALLHKARDAGAVGYHISGVESHKTGNNEQRFLSATATLYSVDRKRLDSGVA